MKWVLSIVLIIGMGGLFIGFSNLSPFASDTHGEITIVVVDEDGTTVAKRTVSFQDDDTLTTVLKRHFDTETQQTTIGTIILGIDTLQTDFETTFIEILVDGVSINHRGERRAVEQEPAMFGADRLPLVDGNTYTFQHAYVNDRGADYE